MCCAGWELNLCLKDATFNDTNCVEAKGEVDSQMKQFEDLYYSTGCDPKKYNCESGANH